MEQMRISWSDPWQVTYSSSGAVLAVQNLSCQSRSPEVSEFLCLNADRCDLGDDSVPLSSQALASLPRARGDLLGNESFKAYTIRVCLCPIVGNCLQPEFFVQEVGIVHFFAAYLCLHPGDAESEDRCLGSFSAAAAFYPIQIHVHCPSDVCKLVPDTAGSRLKLTSPSPDNFRPSWDPTTGCRTAFQTPLQTQPANCIDPSYCVLSGGTREDLKSFGGGPEGPFQFLGDRPLHGRRTFHSAVSFDICFCLSDCRSTLTVPSYFKVGEMSIVPLRLLGPSLLLQVPRRVGVLRLQRVEADIISFQPPPQSVPPAGTEEAYVKLLADDAHQVHDRECGLMPYASYINQSSPEFHLLSISSNDFAQLDEADGAVEAVIRARFRGEPDLANTSHLVFNESLMFLRPGRVAVCYCGVDVAGACRPSFWRLLTHLTVRGPKLLRDLAPYQRWTVSPDVVFSLELLGWGLVATDQILILQPGASCVDDVPSIEDSILRSCPRNCSRFHDGSNGSTPGVALHVLSDSSVPCGGAAEDLGLCPHVFVEAVEVRANGETSEAFLSFSSSPGLMTGDIVSLGNQLACSAESLESGTCSVEDEEELRGVLTAAGSSSGAGDPSFSTFSGDSHYLVGRTVTSTPDKQTFAIDVTWPSARLPVFEVLGAGQWTRHSRAETARELRATHAASELPVCWKPWNGPPVMAGSLSVEEPAEAECQIFLTATGRHQAAPVLITYKTGDLVLDGSVNQMRLEFPAASLLGLRRATDETDVMDELAGDTSAEGAKQAWCGFLLKEIASDGVDGFPLPHGCYLQRPTADSWVFGLVFRPGVLLKPQQRYHLVVNAVIGELAEQGDEVLRILVMDDVELKPFHVVERGRCILRSSPQVPATTAGEPDLQNCAILGGTNGILDLGSELATLRLKLQAGTALRAITASSHLRLFLWPLLGWHLRTGTCDATCSDHTGYCGVVTRMDCTTFSVSSSWPRPNAVRITLPSDLGDMYGGVQSIFEVFNLAPPAGGLFPGRCGVQVTLPSDAAPSYRATSGDFIYRRPTAVAGLLSTAGNERPFQAQEGNTLYVKIRLGATLLSELTDFAATLEVQPPWGYRCSAAEVPEALPSLVEGGSLLGSLQEDGWSSGSQSCFFNLRAGFAIFAGTAFMVRLKVNNPVVPLPRDDPLNAWHLGMESMGSSLSRRKFNASEAFSESLVFGENYTSSVAVLGRLTAVSLQPQGYQPAPSASISGSGTGTVSTVIHVFFRTAQMLVAGGKVLLQAPSGYDFGAVCQVSDLPKDGHHSHYYSIGGDHVTRRLPFVVCAGQQTFNSGFDLALVQLSTRLFAEEMYGWQILVDPPRLSSTLDGDWLIFTEASGQIDGATVSSGTHGGSYISYQLYYRSLASMQFHVSDLKPQELTGKEAILHLLFRLGGIVLNSVLRVTLPIGFIFNFPDASFIATAGNASHIPSLEEALQVPGATIDWPAGLPQQALNVLTFSSASYHPLETYGFLAPVAVPSRSPTESTNSFILEVGYDEEVLSASWDLVRTTGCASDCQASSSETPFQYSQSLADASALQQLRETCREACLLRHGCAEIEITFASLDATCSLCSYMSCERVERFDAELHVLVSLTRPAASIQAAPLVRALLDAEVSFRTQRVAAVSVVRFRIRLVTAVPAPRGALLIQGPEGFFFSEQCQPVDVPPETPDSLVIRSIGDGRIGCTFFRLAGIPRIQLQPGASDLLPGLYLFELPVQNPVALGTETELNAQCGALQCWSFTAVEDASASVLEEVDQRLVVASPPLLEKMALAGLQEVPVPQRVSTNRNDQPSAVNNLIFFFALTVQLFQDTASFQLTAPDGFVFFEDCSEGFVVAEDLVFGSGQAFPSDLHALPAGSAVQCVGKGEVAEATLAPARLAANTKYAFRIRVMNPPVPSTLNPTWSLTLANEASELFDSFPLWQIQGLFLSPPVPANLSSETEVFPQSCFFQAASALNMPPVRVRFRPRSAFQELQMEAPEGWTFLPELYCAFGLDGWVVRFDASIGGNTTCQGVGRQLAVRVASTEDSWSGVSFYELWVAVKPPSLQTDAAVWRLQTFRLDVPADAEVISRLIYDVGIVPGVHVHQRMASWVVINRGNEYLGDTILDLTFVIVLNSPVLADDELMFTAPSGFKLAANLMSGECQQLQVFTGDIPDASGCGHNAGHLLAVASHSASCSTRSLILHINSSWAESIGASIQLNLQAVSASVPPAEEDNFWSASLWRNASVVEGSDLMSWRVIPQVQQPSLQPAIGSRQAAGAYPVQLEFSFVTRAAADRWCLKALQPSAFNFSASMLLSATEARLLPGDAGVQLALSSQLLISIGEVGSYTSMLPQRKYVFMLSNVRLPTLAGIVFFEAHTYDSSGALSNSGKAVEAFAVLGKVEVSDLQVFPWLPETVHEAASALLGSLPPRPGDQALVHISLWLNALSGETLRVSAGDLLLKEMFLKDAQSNNQLRTSTAVSSPSGSDLVAEFLGAVNDDVKHDLEVQLALPADLTGGAGAAPVWRIEVVSDAPNQSDVVLSTNDGDFSPSLSLSYAFQVSISPVAVAPNSEVVLSVSIDPSDAQITHVDLLAPLGVTFPTNCLAASSRSVLSCSAEQAEHYAGRMQLTLTLTLAATMERSVMDDISIKAQNPASTNPDEWNRWLGIGRFGQVEVGWAESDSDYGVASMVASLDYPSEPGNLSLLLTVEVSSRAVADLQASGAEALLELRYRGNSLAAGTSSIGENVGANQTPETTQAEQVQFRCDLGDPPEDNGWRQEGLFWYRSGGWSPLTLPPAADMTMQPCSAAGTSTIVFRITDLTPGTVSLTIEAVLILPDGVSLDTNAVARWDVTLSASGGSIVDMYPGLEAKGWWDNPWALRPLLLSWEGTSSPGAKVPVHILFRKQDGDAPGMMCLESPSTFGQGADSGAGFGISMAQNTGAMTESLGLLPDGWAWIKEAEVDTGSICLLTDAANITNSASGTRFSFTVLVSLPDNNNNWPVDKFWQLRFCRLTCANSSSGEVDTFYMSGFLQGEVYPGWEPVQTNGNVEGRSTWLGLVAAMGALVLGIHVQT
ncbi:PAP18 [Symbiodinium natans]|uniref:PAP18 protein n=1 Tax=Symbiodinium natans TaxID=878477 RepID=A0A812RER6_9DINO|nr:PAP18 [Symbiodinium natans]